MNRRAATSLILLVGALFPAGCSEPLEFSDWTIPVPEGTPVIEYASVLAEERTERIELVEDLTIGPRGDDENYSFFQVRSVKADEEGRIYVLDGGNHRVQVFSASGEYLHTLGKEGSGPGEFRDVGGFSQLNLIIAGDTVIVHDGAQSRISTWDTGGTHLGDVSTTPTRFVDLLAGLPDGSIIAETRVREETEQGERLSLRVIGAFSGKGEPMREHVRLPSPPNFQVGQVGLARPTGSPLFTATGLGDSYATAGDEYQVLALGPDGRARWALRVAHQRRPFTDEHRDTLLEMLRANFPDLDANETEWPTHVGSISGLFLDGHGHLYVTEFVMPYTSPPDEVAVDVHSPEGDRVFAGYMPRVRWTDAAGEFIYAIRTNTETNEQEPVRYRLVEPFE